MNEALVEWLWSRKVGGSESKGGGAIDGCLFRMRARMAKRPAGMGGGSGRAGPRKLSLAQPGTRRPALRAHRRKKRQARPAAAHARDLQGAARKQLKRFRRGSILAVALTAWILLLLGVPGEAQEDVEGAPRAAQEGGQEPGVRPPAARTDTEQVAAPAEAQTPKPAPRRLREDPGEEVARSMEEATSTIRELTVGFVGFLPKLLLALAVLVLGWLVTRLLRPLLRRILGNWRRADAVAALSSVVVWLLAISAALSVLVGDARTLLGSVGLIGLALSWALQSPIESFTGWLLNSFRGYFRLGDRIGVGEVFGDVYRIDFLTTTVWEAGGPDKPVQGAQPTGALVTFPNSEILRANVVNYTRMFPYVWDEVVISVASESDLDYAAEVLVRVAGATVGASMSEPAELYRQMLGASRMDVEIAAEPQVFFSQGDSWTNATIRYLVPARRRRGAASDLLRAVAREMAKPEHERKLIAAYPTARVVMVDPEEFTGG